MKLSPFTPANFPFDVNAEVEWKARVLMVKFTVTGMISKVKLLSEGHTHDGRQNELWKTTCFEWFLKPEARQDYWECNLSPAGNWQLYHLDNYRSALTEEKKLTDMSRQITVRKDSWEIVAAADLSALPLPPGNYQMNLTAVIETTEGGISYWALRHPPDKPDFHRSDFFGFKIQQA